MAQDNNASGYSSANLATRAASKANGMYKCDTWDLVDAKKSKRGIALDTVSRAFLPAELQDKSTAELEAYVDEKAKERETINKELMEINKKRETYIQQERQKTGESNTLDRALIDCIQEQGKARAFEFGDKG
jgi:primosomal protein N'